MEHNEELRIKSSTSFTTTLETVEKSRGDDSYPAVHTTAQLNGYDTEVTIVTKDPMLAMQLTIPGQRIRFTLQEVSLQNYVNLQVYWAEQRKEELSQEEQKRLAMMVAFPDVEQRNELLHARTEPESDRRESRG